MRISTNRFRALVLTLVALLLSLSSVMAQSPTPAEPPEGWELVWSDEFDGPDINLANWTYDIGGHGWGNGEMQYYTDRPENARIEDGILVIEAHQGKYEGNYYTSARLKSEGLQEFQYGRIEARIKVPAGSGTWPAFWMLGANFSEVGWPQSGEIDIMEYTGSEPTRIMGYMHGPGYSGAGGLGKWVLADFDIADDWHTFGIEWEKDKLSWLFDGEVYSTYEVGDLSGREWAFNRPFFIILNLAIGGTLGGPVSLKTKFPLQYQVDYVRVYQRK